MSRIRVMPMPLPAGWAQPKAQPEAQPVKVNAAKVKGGLFIASTATGATLGKAPAAKKTDNNVGTTAAMPMPQIGKNK